MVITSKQCRAARELLGWTQEDLQKKSKLGRETIGNFERGIGNQTLKTLAEMQKAFEKSGIEFISDKDGEGVKLLSKK